MTLNPLSLIKKFIRKFFRFYGYEIIDITPTPFGADPFLDMQSFMQSQEPVIFDVGANMGQSITEFREVFSASKIYSFEPSPETFQKLQANTQEYDNLKLYNSALGAETGEMTFLENSNSDMSSFLPLSNLGWGEIKKETSVEVKTIDQVIAQENISKIDILKSDTQGFDLEVFKGAEESIKAHKIGMIYFEIIFSDMYQNLPDFSEIYTFLTERNFKLVTFYEFHFQENLASWTDALFVHDSYR